MKTPILGSSYVARSVNAADNRMVNLFPEVVPEGGKDPAFLQRAPGLIDTEIMPAGAAQPIVLYSYAERNTSTEYLLIYRGDGQVYYLNSAGTPLTYVGNITAGRTALGMADNGSQVFITTNGVDAWIFEAGVLTAITDLDFTGAGSVTYLDGFFVYNEPFTQKLYVTALLDGFSIDPLDYASSEASPDNIVAVIAINSQLWVMGADSTQVFYNVGNPGFPFEPIPGSFNEVGCTAKFSVCKLDNSVFWLGQDARGNGIVYRSNGYRAERISTHAVEYAVQQASDLSDAIAYTYQKDGHLFYVLWFPTLLTAWVYDVVTQAWHERASWDGSAFTKPVANSYTFYQGQHLLGGHNNGLIYEYSTETYDDAGVANKWLRSWRALAPGQNNLKRTAHHSLQLDCETGAGGTVDLRWSDDGGHSWSNTQNKSMGNPGETWIRVIWRRLGMTMKLRDRVYEVSGTDANKVYIMGAELLMSPTDA